MAEIGVNTPFIVQVYDCAYDNFNKEQMLKVLREHKDKHQTVIKSNNNGYQSPGNLVEVEELKDLFHFIAQSVEPVMASYNINKQEIIITEAWVNFNEGMGQHNQMHIHGGILSGVFYVSTPEGSGRLNIMNPAMNCLWQGHYMAESRNQNTAEVVHIPPKEGLLYLWPSYVPHSVDCNTKDIERVSISFNISAR